MSNDLRPMGGAAPTPPVTAEIIACDACGAAEPIVVPDDSPLRPFILGGLEIKNVVVIKERLVINKDVKGKVETGEFLLEEKLPFQLVLLRLDPGEGTD